VPGSPSVPASRCSIWINPRRVRRLRSVPSSPKMRGNPVSGAEGLVSQYESFICETWSVRRS
jgi:hypothetical protein